MAKNVNILLKLQDQFTGPMKKAAKISAEQSRAMYKLNSSVMSFSRSAADFCRASVKPEAMSPGMTAQTVTPKGRTSFCRAST